MGDHQHGCALPVNRMDQLHDFASRAAVEVSRRFIGEQQLRRVD